MNSATHPAAALLVAAIASLLMLPAVVRAQGPSGAGTASGSHPETGATGPSTPTPSASNAAPPASEAAQTSAASAATTAPVTPKLADLAWLTGSWQGAWGPRSVEQAWAPPSAGVMLGTFQVVENDKTLVVELFTLTETPEGIELRIRHFTPRLAPWEKDGPALLRLTSADAKSAVFENPVNGEPKSQSFRRIDADTYVSRSEVAPQEGNAQIAEIKFHRARVDGAAAKRKPAK